MKQSNALLAAWLVLIALLAGALVYFTFMGQSPPVAPDAPVVPVKAKPPVQKPVMPKASSPEQGRRRAKTDATPPKAQEIVGTVRDREGKPVPGAQVALFRHTTKPGQPETPPDVEELRIVSQIVYVPTDSWELPRRLENWTQGADTPSEDAGPPLASAETGEDGTFKIVLEARVGAGPFRLTAQKTGVGTATVAGVDARQRVEVQLGQATAFAGVVITEVDSVPVAGARVKLEGGSRSYAGVTNAEGKFAIDDVPPGLYQLSVAAKGKTPLFETGFRIAAGEPYTLRLPRGATLIVKCTVDADNSPANAGGSHRTGEPVANAQVVVFSEVTYAYAMGKSSAEGIVEFQGLPAGKYTLNGIVPGLVSAAEVGLDIGRNDLKKEESLVFEPAVETPIEVVDVDGRPIAGMEFFTLNVDDAYDALRSLKVGTTDADGKIKFAFEFDPPRSAIYGFKQGYTFVRACPENYDEGKPMRLVAKKPIRVKGLVKTDDGHAVPDAVVEISVTQDAEEESFDDIRLEIRTDADGRYDFPYLPRAGGISLTATAPDGASSDYVDLEVSDAKSDYEMDLTLETAESIAAKAPAPRGKPSVPPMPPKSNDKK